jgi:hypothetical protein
LKYRHSPVRVATVSRRNGTTTSRQSVRNVDPAGTQVMSRGTVTPLQPSVSEERALELAFRPLHKTAFGIAAGLAFGLLVFVATMLQHARSENPYPLVLLAQYFYGYSVSLRGAFVGLFWGGVAGFAAGWFFAFCRNLAVATTVFLARTRAELEKLRDFLDHI